MHTTLLVLYGVASTLASGLPQKKVTRLDPSSTYTIFSLGADRLLDATADLLQPRPADTITAERVVSRSPATGADRG